jgi:hypothetical protein
LPKEDDNRNQPPVEQDVEGTAANEEDHAPGDDHTPPERTSRSMISQVKVWFKGLSRVKTLIVGLGGVAGALVAIYSLATLLFPALQPTPPSLVAKATLSNPEVIPNVTLGEYIQQSTIVTEKNVASSLSDEQRQRLGSIIYFDVELRGYEGQRCDLRWSIYDADTKQPISGLTQQPAWPTAILVAHHQVSKSQWETWVPFPREGHGPFLVRLEIYTNVGEQEVRLDATEVTIGT